MKIKTLEFVNARTRDGRTYSAGENTTSIVDDADPDMVEMMRRLAAGGLIKILDEPAEPAEPAEPENPVEAPTDTKQTARKTTSTGKAADRT